MQLRIFSSMSPSDRQKFVDRYLRFLRERDGAPDCDKRQLSRREAGLRELAANPIRRHGPAVVEQRLYDENAVEREVAAPGLDPWPLWAICVSRCSRAEEYAVRYLAETGRSTIGSANDPYTFIDLEERYHGRLLDSLLQVVGLTPRWRLPRLTTRLALRAILALPKAVANITVLCGEVIGVATFKLILAAVRELCADQPPARERMEFLIKQILVDEIGHVLFLRSQLGPLRLALARVLLPTVAYVLIADNPEMQRLFGRKRLLAEILNPLLLQQALDEVGGLPLLTEYAPPGSELLQEVLPQA